MAKVQTARPRLRLLGDAALFDAGGRRLALPRRAFVLATYLVLTGSRAETSRRDAANFLWPDSPAAQNNLRQLLKRIRSSQADVHLFEITQTAVRLCLDEVSVDLVDVQELIVNPTFDTAGLLLDLYGSGLQPDAADEGPDGWMTMQAASLQSAVVAAICDLLDRAEARSNPTSAHAIATRVLKIDPHRERAWRALLRGHAAAGQLVGVEKAFERCRAVLKTDLDISPSEETTNLYLKLTGKTNSRPPSTATTPVDRPSLSTETVLQATVPRLVVLPPDRQHDDSLSPIATLMLEDVVVGLCSMKSISVVAPYTSWRLRGGLLEDDATLDRFRIGYVLETALLGGGRDTSRLIAKLYDTASRSILWAENLPLTIDSSQNCYRSISVGIILALADAIERNELARFDAGGSPNAYYWHLIGQKHLRGVDLPEARRAAKAFRSARRLDPEFAPAYSGEARALQREWLLLARAEQDLLDKAEKHGLRATDLDHRDARGFREVARCYLYKRLFDESLAYYAQAEQLSPQHADIIADYADALAHSGRPEDGLAKIERALDLNPIPPEQYWWDAAGMYFQLGQYRKAIKTVGKMEHTTAGLRIAAASWALLGDNKKAAKCAATFLESYPDFRIEKWLALVPNRNPDDTRHYELGLRAAGFQ